MAIVSRNKHDAPAWRTINHVWLWRWVHWCSGHQAFSNDFNSIGLDLSHVTKMLVWSVYTCCNDWACCPSMVEIFQFLGLSFTIFKIGSCSHKGYCIAPHATWSMMSHLILQFHSLYCNFMETLSIPRSIFNCMVQCQTYLLTRPCITIIYWTFLLSRLNGFPIHSTI